MKVARLLRLLAVPAAPSVVAFLAAIASGLTLITPALSDVTPPGEIRGTVELIPGVRATNCALIVDNLAESEPLRNVDCDENGVFRVNLVEPGGVYRITAGAVVNFAEFLVGEGFSTVLPSSGVVTYLPPIVLTRPVAITGRVGGINVQNAGNYFVTVEDQKLSAPLSPSGTFVLNGLPPGRHKLELKPFVGSPTPGPDSVTALDVDALVYQTSMVTGLRIVPSVVARPR